MVSIYSGKILAYCQVLLIVDQGSSHGESQTISYKILPKTVWRNNVLIVTLSLFVKHWQAKISQNSNGAEPEN